MIAVGSVLDANRTSEYLAVIDRTLGNSCRHEYLLCVDEALCESDEKLRENIDVGVARLLENGVNVLDVSGYANKVRQRKSSAK